jgi:thiamine-phosphate pyrophosphorylase
MNRGAAGQTHRVSFLQIFYNSLTWRDFSTRFIIEISMRLPRFYPILDVVTVTRRGLQVVAAAEQILDAGAAILQFRYKGHFSREVFEELTRIADRCREKNALLVVNDRADIARLCGAGLHLGQDDLLPSDARTITGAGTQIGYSTHNETQLRAANSEPVDYLALGPIFGTGSKENPDPLVGVEELRRLRPLTDHPLVAIGGITRANALQLIRAGADSVAVIGDLKPESGSIRDRAREWLELLES